jgi:hypothetical protein
MTNQEWDSFVRLYREVRRACADVATLKTMLKTTEFAVEQNRLEMVAATVRGWEARLEKSRGANFYKKYLAKCEEHIGQAQQTHSDTS